MVTGPRRTNLDQAAHIPEFSETMRAWSYPASLLLASALACEGSEKTEKPPRKVERSVDVERIPVPNHGPEVMAGTPDRRRTKTAEGAIEAVIDGQHQDLRFLPYGKNAAIHAESTGVSRVTLAGARSDAGYPALHLVVENVRLDELELPATFTIGGEKKKKRKSGPVPRILFYETERVVFEAGADQAKSTGEMTLEAFEGDTIRGAFEGTLHPRVEHFGEPKTIERGRFEVSLRLSGIEPG